MGQNNRLGKKLELEDNCGWIDEIESTRENHFSESDTVESGLRNEQRVHTFSKMVTSDCYMEFITPCFVEELYAFDAVADLDYSTNLLSNEFFKRLGVKCEK